MEELKKNTKRSSLYCRLAHTKKERRYERYSIKTS